MTTTCTQTRNDMIAQIGRMNLLAISGGRVRPIDAYAISLPVAYGYSVEVEYVPGLDLYEVRRVFTRNGRATVKGRQTHVYCSDLGETAYRASCYRDPFGA